VEHKLRVDLKRSDYSISVELRNEPNLCCMLNDLEEFRGLVDDSLRECFTGAYRCLPSGVVYFYASNVSSIRNA
jgi:hypothetical protein